MFFDVILNFFQKKLNGLFLRLLNFSNVVLPSLYGSWLLNLDVMLIALIKNVIKSFFTFFTVLDLLCVWKIVRRLLHVDVNKVCFSNVTNIV